MIDARKTYRQRKRTFRRWEWIVWGGVSMGLVIALLIDLPDFTEPAIGVWILLLALAAGTGIALKIIYLLGVMPPRLFCTHCDKYIDSRMLWQCGHCDHQNATSIFLESCVNCGRLPMTVRCPHCQEVNALEEGEHDPAFAAFNPDSVVVEEPVDIKLQRAEILEGKKYDVDAAKLDLELSEILGKMPKPPEPPPKKRTPAEIINADYERHFARDQAVDGLKQRELKRINEQYKDDPDELKHQLGRLQSWVESTME